MKNTIPKNFIATGREGDCLNISVIDTQRSFIDVTNNKAYIYDIYGFRYNVDPKLVRKKLELREVK